MGNFNAIMGPYEMWVWENITQHHDSLADDKRSLAEILQAEGIKLGNSR